MAENVLPKTGMVTQDTGDIDWQTKLNAGIQRLEDRTGLNGPGDPNGSRVGSWYGQSYFDTQNGILYDCVRPGPAAGSGRALWEPASAVPVGTMAAFMRAEVPLGWLAFGGTYSKSQYPRLAAVLPASLIQTATTFTLGTTDLGNSAFSRPIWFTMTGDPNYNGKIQDAFNLAPGAITPEQPGGVDCVVWNIIFGVKF